MMAVMLKLQKMCNDWQVLSACHELGIQLEWRSCECDVDRVIVRERDGLADARNAVGGGDWIRGPRVVFDENVLLYQYYFNYVQCFSTLLHGLYFWSHHCMPRMNHSGALDRYSVVCRLDYSQSESSLYCSL